MSERRSVVQEAQQQQLLRLRQIQGVGRAADLPQPLRNAVEEVQAKPAVNDVSLVERLERRVGLGDQPAKRRALYVRLQKLRALQPELVEQLVAEAWAQSVSARRRDLYFCRAIAMKVIEHKLETGRTVGGEADEI